MKHFFWWCAGVHRETLEKYPQEHNKYVSIGTTVFFTALFAAFAGGYAMYFVFSGSTFAWFYALFFGAIWGLAIFNLDRYIVLSLDKTRNIWMQFLQAVPRILLAIIIGIVISRPLELKIFDKEIRDFLRNEYLIKQSARIDTLNKTFGNKYQIEYAQLAKATVEADSMESRLKTSRQQLNHEIFGTKTDETSGVMGFGPYAKMKDEQLKKEESYLDTLRTRIRTKESELLARKESEGLSNQKILSDKSLDSAINVAGFSDRNMALSNLQQRPDGTVDKSVEYAVQFIALLFIFFECLPVLVKLMSGRDPYDIAIKSVRESQEYESTTSVGVEKSALDKLEDARTEVSIRKRTNAMNQELDDLS